MGNSNTKSDQPNNGKSAGPTGAVMVVGGGIAGIQAALDLADQGFKAFLVEKKSAIGGHMAQLDKTFPTNDCAMCNISPKLVDAGRHLNIEILTDADVLGIEGEAGSFVVKVRQRPRYIDVNKCIACGDCVEVCPVSLPDLFNEGLRERKAAYRLYPQAVPSAYAIEKTGTAPCRDACPAGQRAQGYIALVAEGRYREAFRVIKEDNPFPSVCGRTCHHPCEGHCNRALIDEAVGIMDLKRFVVDHALAYGREPVEAVPRTRPEWVAIVGAGPAGLTAAHDLAKEGYGVTVYEALPVPGGMMRVGIPAHRLPKGVLQQDINDILALGVNLKTGTPVRDPAALLEQGYDAVCLATGISSKDQSLGIEGEESKGVLPAATFLRKVNLGEPVTIGQRVAVVGGGITALDAAAVARRLGSEVYLALDRPLGELPAYHWEVAAVEAEGIHLYERTTATKILAEGGKVARLELAETTKGFTRDASGRRRPKIVQGTEFTIDVDTVIGTVGQFSDLRFLDERFDDLSADSKTLASEMPGLFVVAGRKTGASFIIEAVALGHRVAGSIHRYLQGLPLEQPASTSPPVAKIRRQDLLKRIQTGEIESRPKTKPALLPMEERVSSFREVVLGLTDHQARAEARRCLQCGVCSECLACEYACGVEAIDHNMEAQEREIAVGSVILAPGYQVYNAELSEEFGYGRYANVVTALQFERMLSASGPTMGHVRRPSDSKTPGKIAFLQCIGSRDQSHDYCSAVCCMSATKEAVIAKEHHPDLDVHVFMMDMRAFSKGYWSYFERARDRYGINYTRARISMLHEEPNSHALILEFQDDAGQLVSERFDMVVLSVGMEISDSVRELGDRLGVELDEYGFCHSVRFNPIETSRPGIYAAGPFREPKDIPESVVEASGAAAASAGLLASSRWTQTRERSYPPERDVSSEEPRIGVFVCHCGSNIGGFLDVPSVTEYARALPGVVHAEDNLYTCSQDSIQLITKRAEEHDLNRIVIASCSPLTHAPLFKDSIRAAGLNPYLFDMANIRNQCSWVHSDDWDSATDKAKDLLRMAVARAALLEARHTVEVPVHQSALVIGGGVAGMTAAISLADQGFPVHLVERDKQLGGNLRHIYTSVQDQDPREILSRLIGGVEENQIINLHTESRVVRASGFAGNFVSVVEHQDGSQEEIQHGATILATGAQEYRGPEYGYGTNPRIVTQQELEGLLGDWGSGTGDWGVGIGDQGSGIGDQGSGIGDRGSGIGDRGSGIGDRGSGIGDWGSGIRDWGSVNSPDSSPKSVVMIQCVGPAEKFCSRICCTVALKNALILKERDPDAQVTVIYKDIRTYGFKERLYTSAREKGVIFIRYDDDRRPKVASEEDGSLTVEVEDPVLGRSFKLQPNLLVLSMPVVPRPDVAELAVIYKVPTDADGFFSEAHVKLRPVDFATEGVFMAGMAHYPKLTEETMIQAQAAAARAARILSRDTLTAGGRVAIVDAQRCTGCLTCVRICPFGVPIMEPHLTGVGNINGAAYIEPAVCQGCGSCAAECPAQAIQLSHYTNEQMAAKVHALINRRPEIIPLEDVKAVAA
ncbi:MAG: FAD-dependent oxidoreductase [Candidatus Promineifilaceae bacterium]